MSGKESKHNSHSEKEKKIFTGKILEKVYFEKWDLKDTEGLKCEKEGDCPLDNVELWILASTKLISFLIR